MLCSGAGNGHLAFRHPLVRAAAFRISGPGWRTRAHKRAAEYLAGHDASSIRRAPHLEYSAQLGDVEAAEVLADAARSVLGTAPATSARWTRAALRALPDGAAYAERRSQVRLELAKALVLSGQLTDCEIELQELGSLTGQARTGAVRLRAMTVRLLGRPHEASDLARAELTSTIDTWARLVLQFELAVGELLSLHWEEGERVAAALVRTTGDHHPGVEAAAAVVDALGPVSRGSLGEVLGRLERARNLVDSLDDGSLRDVIQVVIPLAWAELFCDQPDHALRHLDRGMQLAHRYARVYVLPQMHPIKAMALSMVGRIDDSLREAENAEETARAVGSAEMVAFALSVGLQPLWWRDGPKAASAAMAKLELAGSISTAWHRLVADLLVADVALGLGRTDECQARMLSWLAEDAVRLGLAPTSYVLLGKAHLADGDLVGAQGWLDEARAAASEAPLASSQGSIALADVDVLLAENRAADAVQQAGSAIEHFEACGQLIRASQARMTLAEALLRDGRIDDARSEVGRAKDQLTDVGADWLADQADRAQRRLGARLPRHRQPGVVSAALTKREHEVAELVAKRLTNREIAAELYLSPRTVDAHVARIFSKLGINSRAAVARHLTTS
ncbi:MAG: LuxR C-terminal-related transcriptional regulator [Acidimicrobiales bacterium]